MVRHFDNPKQSPEGIEMLVRAIFVSKYEEIPRQAQLQCWEAVSTVRFGHYGDITFSGRGDVAVSLGNVLYWWVSDTTPSIYCITEHCFTNRIQNGRIDHPPLDI